jgi:hypothetical protein
MSSYWLRVLERTGYSALDDKSNLESVCEMIYDMLHIAHPTPLLDAASAKQHLLLEIKNMADYMHSIGEAAVANIVTMLQCDLTVVTKDNILTKGEIFGITGEAANNTFNEASTFAGKLLITQIRIICVLYANGYFSGTGNVDKITAECAVIFGDLLSVPEVSVALTAEFERRELSTRLWILVGGADERLDVDQLSGRNILDEIGCLQNELEEYTLMKYPIHDSNGELMHLKVAYLRGHTDAVLFLTVLPLHGFLLSASADTTIKVLTSPFFQKPQPEQLHCYY